MIWCAFSSSLPRCARPMSSHFDAVGLPTASSVQVAVGFCVATSREAADGRASRYPVAEPHATDFGGMVKNTCALIPRLDGSPKKLASYRLDWIAMTTRRPIRTVAFAIRYK